MRDGVWIACAETVLDDEAASGTFNLRSGLQLSLGHAVHRDADVTLIEALVGELCHSSEDVLVGILAQGDGLRGHARERTLVLIPCSLRVDLLGQILTERNFELGLNERHQVEGSVVDGHVRHGHLQAYAVLSGHDLIELQHLVAECLYLTGLFHLYIVDADGPHLVTLDTSHDVQTYGQAETFVQGGDHLLDGQLNGTRGCDVALRVGQGREQQNLALLARLGSLREQLTESSLLVGLLTAGVGLFVFHVEGDAVHATFTHLNLAREVENLHLLLFCQFTVGGLHIDVAELLVGSKALLTELFKSLFFHCLKRF